MARFRRRFATVVSGLCTTLAVLACDGGSKLDGTTHCSAGVNDICASGELCRDQLSGAADDAGTEHGCIAVPDGCDIHDCNGSACPKCIVDLCEPPANHPDL